MAEKKAKFSREYGLFLELLRAEREAAGMTQTDLAKRLKMTQSSVSKCERGERRLDAIETRQICIAIGTQFAVFAAKLDAAIERTPAARKSAARN
jgi:transcriptional regulator with XRE-family HTH domain